MNLNDIKLHQLEDTIKNGGIARFPAAMAVREIDILKLYEPNYNSIFDYMKSVFKWERRKTKLVLYDAGIYAVLQQAFADQRWKLPKFRNQLKGITTIYPELIPAIWNQITALGTLPESQRLESTRTIQKRIEDEYNNSKYVSYMSLIYSKKFNGDCEELLAIIQNEYDAVKLAIALYFLDHTQESVHDGLHGIKLYSVVGKLKHWGRDRVKGLVRIGSIIDSISKDPSLPLPNDVEVVRLILSPDPNHHRLIWGLAVDKARIAGCVTPTKTMMKEAIKTAAEYLGSIPHKNNANLVNGSKSDVINSIYTDNWSDHHINMLTPSLVYFNQQPEISAGLIHHQTSLNPMGTFQLSTNFNNQPPTTLALPDPNTARHLHLDQKIIPQKSTIQSQTDLKQSNSSNNPIPFNNATLW